MTTHNSDCAFYKTYGSDKRPGPCTCGAEQAKETAPTPDAWGDLLGAATEIAAERDRLKGHYEQLKERYNNCRADYDALEKRNAVLVEVLKNLMDPNQISDHSKARAALAGEAP